MKKYLPTILTFALILVGGVFIFAPHVAFAEESYVQQISTSVINSFIANVGYQILSFASVLVAAAGTFLSVSMNLTLHIKDIYLQLAAIKNVWVVIRDLTSMFVIFSLLYYSILTIVGYGEGKVSKLIVKIFLAGIFINFSLFFVRVAIDASNLVSLQFYEAIAPGTSENIGTDAAFNSGGLSNVFLQSLKIQKVYTASSIGGKGVDISAGIIFATIGGTIIMITAAFSLFAAAIAFTVRTAILLFVMAMSPVYFAGMIFPDIKTKVSDKIMSLFVGQLIFMPVYLLLMYVALRVISDPKFNAMFQPAATSAANAPYAYTWSSIIVQYTIAILFIDAPLAVAISLGGKGMGFVPTGASMSKYLGKSVGGFLKRNTYGAVANSVANSDIMNVAASKNIVAAGALRQLRGVAKEYKEYETKKGEEKAAFGKFAAEERT